jgi:hypothetical protein
MEQDEPSGSGSGAVSRAGGCVQRDQARIQAIIPFRRNSAIPGVDAWAGKASASSRSRS